MKKRTNSHKKSNFLFKLSLLTFIIAIISLIIGSFVTEASLTENISITIFSISLFLTVFLFPLAIAFRFIKEDKSKKKSKRPILISIVCILGFLGALLVFISPLLFLIPEELIPPEEIVLPIWLIISSVIISLGIIYSLSLVWNMKKKGVYYFTVLTIINYIISYTVFEFSSYDLIYPIIYISILYFYLKKMN
jgi:amino acid transporter